MHTRYAALVLLTLAVALPASAQSLARQRALAYVQTNAPRHGLTTADVARLIVTDETTSRRSGVTHVYVRQTIGDVPVVAGAMTINVMPDGRVLLATGDLVPGLALRVASRAAALSPAQAARVLAEAVGLTPTEAFTTIQQKTVGSPGVYLSDGGVSRQPIAASLVYADAGDGQLRLAYEVELAERTAPHVWLGTIDAATGRVIRREDLVIHDAFAGDDPAAVAVPAVPAVPAPRSDAPLAARVPLAPARLAPMMPLAQEAAAMTTPGAAYRVYAYPVIAPMYTTPLPPADARTLASGMEGAVASPHGWHDTDGAPGAEFTTTWGNNAQAYTDTDTNNTPDAGSSPDGGATLQFVFPLDLTQAPATYRPAAVTNLFYWSNLLHDIYYNYGFDEPSGNFQTNNYGRGGPTTNGGDAVRAEAQDGGGFENANFYTPLDGAGGGGGFYPRMQMYLGNTANPDVDGDLDNHVIAHEYTHGLTKRLTGGPTVECLRNGEQMGEGWSDWYGLMVTMTAADTRADRRTVGNYLFGQPVSGAGIRPAPYSTAFTTNNYTYGRTRSGLAVPHGIGFVWATALWDVTWDLIAAHGFSANVHDADGTAGNQIALNIVTEALKMQPCSPGFVDGRNAILAADQALYNGAHVNLLWTAFARRGLGATASQGSADTNADNVESFVEPEAIAPTAVTDLAAIPNGDYVTLAFTATGDDGSVGTAATYDVRRSATPILTDADFAAATVVPVTVVPRVAGTAERVAVNGLAFTTRYYFALKVSDESLNQSAVSNQATTTTLAAPTATVPTAPITVRTATEATATLSIANAGPSDLRFSLDLAEAAPRPMPEAPAGTVAAAPELPKGTDGEPGEAQLLGSGGPDAFGYRWTDSNEPGGPAYNWVDISTTGTQVTLTDDAETNLTLPFAFSFYGQDYTAVRLGANGALILGATTGDVGTTNAAIPTAAAPNALVAGFWDDLNPEVGGQVRHQNMGDGRFVVSWLAVPRYNDPASVVTFQIILARGGAITYQYRTMTGTTNQATVGIENAAGTVGLQTAFNTAYVQNNLAVRYAALFVESDVTAGLIPAGQSRTVALRFVATGLAAGTYRANLTVRTNSPSAATTVIPLTLTVGAVADEGGPLDFEGTHLLGAVYPNPAAGASRVDLAVAEAQTVRAELFDALGRRVAVVFDGPVTARTNVAVPVGTGALATGTYVLRITGETFQDARRVTVVR